MASDFDPKVRFLLRPTVIGEAIMVRLAAPGVDRAAESRRWIELGFAAEQAGFRMDGSQLRHADRAWHVQPDLPPTIPVAVPPQRREVKEEGKAAAAQPVSQVPSPAPASVFADTRNGQQPEDSQPSGGSMTDRLRKLSAH